MLGKLLVYFLCISLLAFIYVYKIPILCSECEKPTGTAANFFRCIVNEDELCQVHNEMKGAEEKVGDFLTWVKDIITKDIPQKIFDELSTIFGYFEPIQDAITNMINTIIEGITYIKDDVTSKITTFFEDLIENITDMFSNIGTGISNFAGLMYQSIDNLRINIKLKIERLGADIQNKLDEFIFKPINEKVIKPIKNAFEAIGNFFNGLVNTIIAPFKDFFTTLANVCIRSDIIPRIDLKVATIGPYTLNICPFSWMNDVYEKIKNGITSAFEKILAPITTAFDSVNNALNQFKEVVANGIQKVKDFFWKAIETIQKSIERAIDPISKFFSGLSEKISTTFDKVYKEVMSKITQLQKSIITFFKDIWKNIKSSMEKMIKPIKDVFLKLWDNFQQTFKNFVKSLNDVYVEVNKQWGIIYQYIIKRIFYITYMAWINFIDWSLGFLPISKTMKINIVNSLLVMGLMGVCVYYYNIIGSAVATAINGVLTILGDLYGVLSGSIFPLISMVTDVAYTLLSNLPTLTFAMDTFAFLSPARIIQNVFQQLMDLAEVFVGGARDIILTPYLIAVFICVLIISIVVGIHKYMSGKKIKATVLDKLVDKLIKPRKDIVKSINYKDIDKNITKASVSKPIEMPNETKMEGIMKEFTDKMNKFKKRVDLIEQVRKKYEPDPANPNKDLETNLNSMISELNSRISQAGL